MSELLNIEKTTMKNNSEKSIVNAAQSTGYPTLEMFWKSQQNQMENIKDFKDRLLLPPTRIKKMMKKNEDVRMVAGESPVLLAKACELFIQDLTLRSSLHAQENHRRILKKDDLTDVIVQTDYFDFLLDVVHRNGATDPFAPNSVPLYAAGGSNEEDGNNLDQ
ncbi:nuclear transcription factor Y subunit C-1-like [Solanum pennellii]|uniref:Nuclear transcription factor Y subunit C-1-like n=1 Tax=Solanum pennellii TaxID=28526 RepID=A0ABM1V649_SOLPN|nr:nuclear transcription factor Y subunit C-1-like [Solanum pennellii]